MKQNLRGYMKKVITKANLPFKPGYILAKNVFKKPDDNTEYIIIPWKRFREDAKNIDFEYASSLNVFNDFFILDENMSQILRFADIEYGTWKENYNKCDISMLLYRNVLPFDVYFRNNTVKSYTRLLIKLLFNEYCLPNSESYRKDYFIYYKNGERYLIYNLSNEAVKVEIGDGNIAILQYDTRPVAADMAQNDQYLEAFVRMLAKVASKDTQIIVYIGICPLSANNQLFVKRMIVDRKELANKLQLRFKNVKAVYDYREMKI